VPGNSLQVHVLESSTAASATAAERVHEFILSGCKIIAVPGGKTPQLFYQLLADNIHDWKGVKLVLTDERMVPPEDSHSNTSMLQQNLFAHCACESLPDYMPLLPKNDFMDKTKTRQFLDQCVQPHLPPKAAVCGLGSDGHIAGLFEDDIDSFSTKESFTFSNRTFANHQRVSLSMHTLCSIPAIICLVLGKKKGDILNTVFNAETTMPSSPIEFLINHSPGSITFICDRAAAPDFLSDGTSTHYCN